MRALTSTVLMPITVTGDRQYYISVKHGHIPQKEVGGVCVPGRVLDHGAGPWQEISMLPARVLPIAFHLL